MKDALLRFIRWFEPLVTELNQVTGHREPSVGKVMGWITFALDVWIVHHIVTHPKEVPHVDLVFNFLEVFTLFILSFMFSHKLILLKGKFSLPGTGGDSNDPNGPEPTKPEI